MCVCVWVGGYVGVNIFSVNKGMCNALSVVHVCTCCTIMSTICTQSKVAVVPTNAGG